MLVVPSGVRRLSAATHARRRRRGRRARRRGGAAVAHARLRCARRAAASVTPTVNAGAGARRRVGARAGAMRMPVAAARACHGGARPAQAAAGDHERRDRRQRLSPCIVGADFLLGAPSWPRSASRATIPSVALASAARRTRRRGRWRRRGGGSTRRGAPRPCGWPSAASEVVAVAGCAAPGPCTPRTARSSKATAVLAEARRRSPWRRGSRSVGRLARATEHVAERLDVRALVRRRPRRACSARPPASQRSDAARPRL